MTVDGMKLWRGVSDRKVLQAGTNWISWAPGRCSYIERFDMWICPKMAPANAMVSNDTSSFAYS
jgi:hypothetical protein